MLYAVKLLISAAMIVLVSEISKKYPGIGGLLASLPLTSLLGIIWLQLETRDSALISAHSRAVFWYVLPSLPMFLLLPWLLRLKWPFGWALLACCSLTMLLYAGMMRGLQQFNIAL